MLSIFASTIAFFVAFYFIKRYFDGTDIPKGMTRSAVIFTLAAAISWGVAALVEKISR